MNIRRVVAIVFVGLVCQSNAIARLEDPGWIFSPAVGISRPNIDVIIDDVYNGRFSGLAEITTDLPEDVQGQSAYPSEPFDFENYLPAQDVGVDTGIEVTRNFGVLNDFFIGISAWEVSSKANTDNIRFPMQGDRNNIANYERRAKLSYTQFYIGMRRYFLKRSSRFNFFGHAAIHELFDIDYKENHVFQFTSGKPAGFSRNYIITAQGTGLMLLQLGGGLEVRFADRFSFTLDGGYAFSLHPGTLKGLAVREDFNNGDRITRFPDYLSTDPVTQNIMVLDRYEEKKEIQLLMNGWRVVGKFNISF